MSESAQPQLPPRPETYIDRTVERIKPGEDTIAIRYMAALEAENESLKAKLTSSGICELAVDNPNLASYAKEWEGRAEKAEAERDKNLRFYENEVANHKVSIAQWEEVETERDQALEVIREYRLSSISHRLCSIDFGCCSTCIQADALLSRETKET